MSRSTTRKKALEWGVTGPGLRATGIDYDLRKARPYSGYENFDFEVPLAQNGDAYDRCLVRLEEMRQSLRIIKQCSGQHAGRPVQGRPSADLCRRPRNAPCSTSKP
jgi:NADH:ubiquinone oxidoreductase subunit D